MRGERSDELRPAEKVDASTQTITPFRDTDKAKRTKSKEGILQAPEAKKELFKLTIPPSLVTTAQKVVQVLNRDWPSWLYLSTSLPVLALTIGLIASQPSGGSPAKVNFTFFVVIFSYFCLFFESFNHDVEPFYLGVGLNIIFYFSVAMAMTVATAPVGSCNDPRYLDHNALIDGVTSRCRTAQAVVAFLWFC